MSKVKLSKENLLNLLFANKEQTIIANKIFENNVGIKSTTGNMVKSDGTNTQLGSTYQHTRLNGNNKRPDYHDGTNTTDIALLSDVMTPSNQKITNIFTNTAIGVYSYTAPSNGFLWILATININSKCFLRNTTTGLEFGFDNAVSNAIKQSMDGFIPCAKGDTIQLVIENNQIENIWNSAFIKSIGG